MANAKLFREIKEELKTNGIKLTDKNEKKILKEEYHKKIDEIINGKEEAKFEKCPNCNQNTLVDITDEQYLGNDIILNSKVCFSCGYYEKKAIEQDKEILEIWKENYVE